MFLIASWAPIAFSEILVCSFAVSCLAKAAYTGLFADPSEQTGKSPLKLSPHKLHETEKIDALRFDLPLKESCDLRDSLQNLITKLEHFCVEKNEDEQILNQIDRDDPFEREQRELVNLFKECLSSNKRAEVQFQYPNSFKLLNNYFHEKHLINDAIEKTSELKTKFPKTWADEIRTEVKDLGQKYISYFERVHHMIDETRENQQQDFSREKTRSDHHNSYAAIGLSV